MCASQHEVSQSPYLEPNLISCWQVRIRRRDQNLETIGTMILPFVCWQSDVLLNDQLEGEDWRMHHQVLRLGVNSNQYGYYKQAPGNGAHYVLLRELSQGARNCFLKVLPKPGQLS